MINTKEENKTGREVRSAVRAGGEWGAVLIRSGGFTGKVIFKQGLKGGER